MEEHKKLEGLDPFQNSLEEKLEKTKKCSQKCIESTTMKISNPTDSSGSSENGRQQKKKSNLFYLSNHPSSKTATLSYEVWS